MVFSKEKWNNADELNKFIPVSAALSFESVQSSLKDAWRLFVLPLLGEPLTEEVKAYYEDDAPTALQLKVLEECQCAVANLAFWYNYQELNVRISDQGMHRQESDGSFKQTFKYQEDQLRASFKNKGFNALDRLIEIFDKNKKDFPLYEQSPAYASRKSAIVRSTSEVDANYFINKSHLIFLRLKPIFKFVEETVLPSVLGYELNKALMVAIKDGEDKIGDTTTEEFRLRCASFVVLKSIAQLIRQTGSLTDRGLYFAQLNEGDGNLSARPANKEAALSRVAEVEQQAEAYLSQLMNFIQFSLPDYYKGRQSDVLNRDNNHKRTMFL